MIRTLKPGPFSTSVLWNIGSLIVAAVGGVLVNLVIIRFQGEAALGIFNQVYAIYIILSQIGVGGLQFSVLKHVSYHQQDRAICATITTAALVLVIAISLALSALLLVFAAPIGQLLNSAEVSHGLVLALPGLLFFGLNKVLINVVNGLNHMRAYAILRALRFIFLFAALIIIIASELPAAHLPLALTAAEAALLGVMSIYVYGFLLPRRPIAGITHWFREHLSFGLRGMFSGILIEMNTRVDVLMLGYFTTDSIVGLYSFVAILAEGFSQIPQAVRWNLDPVIGNLFSTSQQNEITSVSRRVRRVFFPAMLGITLIAVAGYPLYHIISTGNDDFTMSWGLFTILMVGIAASAGYKPFSGLLLQAGRPGIYTLSLLGVVLCNLVLNALFIPLWGAYGAAAATALAFVVDAGLLVWLSRRQLGVQL